MVSTVATATPPGYYRAYEKKGPATAATAGIDTISSDGDREGQQHTRNPGGQEVYDEMVELLDVHLGELEEGDRYRDRDHEVQLWECAEDWAREVEASIRERLREAFEL
ncbi:hypothetical protein PG985_005664 [Apiospora marii]|uniref:uncharacterized protein n=1 Tax=Apiospora marii TaxID=335849 RepID=UPI00312EAF0E